MFWTVTLSLLAGMGQLLKLFFLTVLISCGAAILFPVTPEAPEAAGTEEVQA